MDRFSPEHEAWCRSVDPTYVARFEERERKAAAPAPVAAPALTPAPARQREMKAADRAEYDALLKKLADAREADDADAMIEVLNGWRFMHLVIMDKYYGVRAAGDDRKFNIGMLLAFILAERNYTSGIFAAHIARRKKLETRIAAIEDRPIMRYRGTWSSDVQCNAGDFITHDGSIWYCRESTRDRPGTSDAFQLAVKHGRDLR